MVLVRLSMGWFGGLITRRSQERTKEAYDCRVHLEGDQSVRIMKLPLYAYSTETSAAVGAGDLLLIERDDRADRGYSRRGRAEQSARRFRSRRRKTGIQ